MQRLFLTVVAALVPTACLPPPQDAGEAETTGSESGGASGSSDDATTGADSGGESAGAEGPLDPDMEWPLELDVDPNAYIYPMVASPDGVVAVLQGQATTTELFEVSSSIELLWSRTFDDTAIDALTPMGGGQYLLGGTVMMASGNTPSAWRLSCCVGSEYQTFPLMPSDSPATIAAIEPYAGGIFMAASLVEGAGELAAFMRTELDFFPDLESELGTYEGFVMGSARTPSGGVMVTVMANGHYMRYEVALDGTVTESELDQLTALVGSGDDLMSMTFGSHELHLQPYGGGPEVEVPISEIDFQTAGFVYGRGEHLAFVHDFSLPGGGSTMRLTEFDESGTVLRELDIPHTLDDHSHCLPSAVAVAEDGAIYVAMNEYVPDGGATAVLIHRIDPL